MFQTAFGREIWEKKYAGQFTDPVDFYRSMAKRMSLGDPELEQKFFSMLIEQRFSPGGRILAFTGRPQSSVSLMNCTTHQVADDTLEEISETVWTIMKASSHGQGIGIDLSKLRPRGASVNNAAKTSTGAISFMEMLNNVGGTIGQEGRRAALLFSMRVDHPDLWRKDAQDITCPKCNGAGCMNCKGTGSIPYDFLHVKTLPGHVESANISVMITDEFMQAVENDQMWALYFKGESGGEQFSVANLVPARELFRELARSAWQSAEPGVLFLDTIKRQSNSDLFGDRWEVVGCNACSEMMLDQDGVCNLGSLNLTKYVTDPYTEYADFDMDAFIADVELAVEFLDNVLEIELTENRSISQAQRESVQMLRRVGLGVMGLADLLVMMGLRYKYEQNTILFLRQVFNNMRHAAYRTSMYLAARKGPAGVWAALTVEERQQVVERGHYANLTSLLKKGIVQFGLRNVTLLSIAPTGSISNLFGISSGIEPLFAREYKRRVRMGGQDEIITYVHPGVTETRARGIPDEVWDTAYDVSPEDHVQIQALVQAYVDSAIAKTTNLPPTATVDDVANIYMLAWKLGLKGITVYRDGSRDEQVLYTMEEQKQDEHTCPSCGEKLVKHDGCEQCMSCGYGKCSL